MTYSPLLENVPRILVHARGMMIPFEVDFWERLRFALRDQGCELMLIGHHRPNDPMDVPLLKVLNSLDAVWTMGHDQGWGAWLPETEFLDDDKLLQRERDWRGTERDDEHREQRRKALYFYRNYYSSALKLAKPALTVTWNGHHPQEMILGDLCRRAGCPVQYIERGPFFGTIQVDAEGVLGGSSIARKTDWTWPNEEVANYWRTIFTRVADEHRDVKSTWWEQPESIGPESLRKRLKIPENKKILLFAGQVDNDIQTILYSPIFKSNLEAFQWFCREMADNDQVFILGKHHPKSNESPEGYQHVTANMGIWTTDAAIDDCLALADRVVAVNSTVIYEALLFDKPVLTLGLGLFTGKQFTYEIQNPARDTLIVRKWLDGRRWPERYQRWTDFGAYLLYHGLYTMREPKSTLGQRDAKDLAKKLTETVRSSLPPNFDTLPAPRPILDEIGLCNDFRQQLWGQHIPNKTQDPLYLRILRKLRRKLRNVTVENAP